MPALEIVSRKGHLPGGPLRLGALALVAAGLLAACSGGGAHQSRQPGPRRGEAILSPLSVYEQLGLLAGTAEFPAVASFATVAGPTDSTYVIFGLSLPNSALMFQRDGTSGFVGRYGVTLSFSRGGEVVRRAGGEEEVRVPTFAETGRTDESVVYQTVVALAPGSYTVELEARDLSVAQKRIKMQDTLVVPAYRGDGRRLAGPFFVYQADGRESSTTTPGLIVNPRHTLPYGSESLKVYLEGYGIPRGEPVRVRLLGPENEDLWHTEVTLSDGDAEVSHLVLDLPGANLPLGRLWIEATVGSDSGATPERTPLVVTVSDQWMVSNFDEMLEFLGYIATPAELDSLRKATPAERVELWDRFWASRDPAAASAGINVFREQFFERLRLASLYFSEPGRPGWKTDRGEVYIVLGAPSYVVDRYLRNTSARPDAYDWVYENGPTGRLVLTFAERYSADRFELTPASRVAFRSAANWVKNRRR
jgi:GWxTD domain-containing protein